MKKSNRGFIAVDFLFSLTIVCIFCFILFALSFTFTVVEVSQYIAFSVSRAHMAGHIDQQKQEQMAKNKFASLSKNPIFAPLFSNGWFELDGLDIRGGGESGKNFADEYPKTADVTPVGIRLRFTANILNLNFPILGKTSTQDEGFSAYVTGLLIREPTSAECRQGLQRESRYNAILNLDSRFNIGKGTADKYVAMEDNGC